MKHLTQTKWTPRSKCSCPASVSLLCLVLQARGGTGHPDFCTSVEPNTWPRGITTEIQTRRDTWLQTGINTFSWTLLRLKTYSYIFMVSDGEHVKGTIKKPSADFMLIMMNVCKCEEPCACACN